MVGEFPELQGVMGRYYAHDEGLDASIAGAIEEHYRPQGPGDAVPTAPVSIAVGLADRLDMLVGFWAIDEKPTGSKDPVCPAPRRSREHSAHPRKWPAHSAASRNFAGATSSTLSSSRNRIGGDFDGRELLAFFAERLKVHLRDKGSRHDLIDAVFSLGDEDDLLMIVNRVEALGRFLDGDAGHQLLDRRQEGHQHSAHRGEEGRPLSFRAGGRRLNSCRRRSGR